MTTLAKLAKDLASYDALDSLASIAALQLLPENADYTLRLEALAFAAACNPHVLGNQAISAKQLREIVGQVPSQICTLEDPFENLFSEALPFFGGTYIVLPGINTEITFVLRHLTTAIFLHQAPFSTRQFPSEIALQYRAALIISDETARRAGLRRGLTSVLRRKESIYVPPSKYLKSLKAAVFYSLGDLEKLFASRGIQLRALEPLITQLGELNAHAYDPDANGLVVRPLIQTDNELVLAIPAAVPFAIRHMVLNRAVGLEILDELADRYLDAIWHTVKRSLSWQRIDRVPFAFEEFAPLALPLFREAMYAPDSDKAMYVLLITDSFENYDPENAFTEWPAERIDAILAQRCREVQQRLYSRSTPPNDLLALVILQGIGRTQVLGLQESLEPGLPQLLVMSAADLETIACLELGEPLALWKYANAKKRLHDRCTVMPSGELNEYAAYRSHRHSFYFSDQGMPDVAILDMGYTKPVLEEAYHKRDVHAVPSFTPGRFIEVLALHGSKTPIYAPVSDFQSDVQLFVEGLPLPTWICGPVDNEERSRLRALYLVFVDAIAYWLWQFTPSIEVPLQVLKSRMPLLLIRLYIEPGDGWHTVHSDDETQLANDSIEVTPTDTGALDVVLRSTAANLFGTMTNEGERKLMFLILQGIGKLLPRKATAKISASRCRKIVDKHAPLGRKKKINIVSPAYTPELDNRNLPRYRQVAEADEEVLLDELGEYLVRTKKYKVGRVFEGRKEQTEILAQAVEFFYNKLETLIGSLSSVYLIEQLVARGEAIVHEEKQFLFNAPLRMACYSEQTDIIDELKRETPKRAKAAIASRFLIEFAAAQPPDGFRPFSLSVYDRLLALGAQIANLGMESDLVHFGLAEVQLSILPSFRLGGARGDYDKSLSAYGSIIATGDIQRASEGFERYWDRPLATSHHPDNLTRMNDASIHEFGFPLTEMVDFLTACVSEADEKFSGDVAIQRQEDFIDGMAQRLAWPKEKTSSIHKLFVLGPRTDFLDPGPDVYPWRFNRSLSYIRRPLVLKLQKGEPYLIWGKRHMWRAVRYLVFLCIDGRLRARTDSMRGLLGELNKERGDAFTSTVAKVFETKGTRFVVRRKVTKVKGKRLGSPGPDLGDIDVLVIDRSRKEMLLLECKDLAVARTAPELANQLENLFVGTEKRQSTAAVHLARTSWIEKHLREALEMGNIRDIKGWSVSAKIIVDHDPLTPHLHKSPLAVLSLAQLERSYDVST